MPGKIKTHHKKPQPKRHGTHHRHTKQYIKVYWPYVPMLLIVAFGAFISSVSNSAHGNVLAFATEMSHQSLLEATNTQRQKNHTPTLSLNDHLSKAAQAKANDMATRNYWSHNTPDGDLPWVFLEQAGYSYRKAGENLAYGFTSSAMTIEGWMNSPSHRANMLDNTFSEVGFGYLNVDSYNNSGKQTVVVAMYGQPTRGANPSAAPQQSQTTPLANTNQTPLTGSKVSSLDIIIRQAPWIGAGIIIGSCLAALFMTLKHSLALRRLLLHGESFVIHHPVFDIALVTFITASYVLYQTGGFIL